MKRSQFIALISCLPFVGKLKQKKLILKCHGKEIAQFYNVPNVRLQDYNHAVYSNLEEKQK